MKTCKAFLALFCFCAVFLLSPAQQVRNSVKLGIATGGFSRECLLISAEHAFGRNVSGVLQGGWSWHKNPGATSDGSYQIGLHGHVDLRAYFALRRDLLLSGFHLGASVGYDRMNTRLQGISTAIVRRYSPMVGIAIGYQHLFGRGFSVDLGMRMLRTIDYRQETYDTAGNLLFTDEDSHWFLVKPYLGVGWSF